MKYIELEVLRHWRYCNVKNGEKIPYPAGWQNNPKSIGQIESANVGLLLGPASGGIVALDFDGTSAWTWFDQRIGCAIPTTVMWTSGKDSRCQMVFQVPAQYWDYVRTQKIAHSRDALITQGEGFEFRWTGCQSVMPPSQLADGRQYAWLRSPTQSTVAELPEEILCYWLQMADTPSRVNTNPVEDLAVDSIDEKRFRELTAVLELVQQRNPSPDYDVWMRIAFATASEVGNSVAAVLLSTFWPEREPGEYARLLSSRDPSRSPTIKSLVFMVQEQNRQQHTEKYAAYLKGQQEIKELERIIKEKRNEQSQH